MISVSVSQVISVSRVKSYRTETKCLCLLPCQRLGETICGHRIRGAMFWVKLALFLLPSCYSVPSISTASLKRCSSPGELMPRNASAWSQKAGHKNAMIDTLLRSSNRADTQIRIEMAMVKPSCIRTKLVRLMSNSWRLFVYVREGEVQQVWNESTYARCTTTKWVDELTDHSCSWKTSLCTTNGSSSKPLHINCRFCRRKAFRSGECLVIVTSQFTSPPLRLSNSKSFNPYAEG